MLASPLPCRPNSSGLVGIHFLPMGAACPTSGKTRLPLGPGSQPKGTPLKECEFQDQSPSYSPSSILLCWCPLGHWGLARMVVHRMMHFVVSLTRVPASLIAQLAKNPPAIQGTPVFLGFPCGSAGKESSPQCRRPGFNPWVGKISRRREKATHSGILAWRIPWTTVHGVTKSWTRLSHFHFQGSLGQCLSVKPVSSYSAALHSQAMAGKHF